MNDVIEMEMSAFLKVVQIIQRSRKSAINIHFYFSMGINGRDCVMRAVCERAEAHVFTDGLLAHLLTVILE